MKKDPIILITGVAGLAGSYLARYILANRLDRVIGVIHKSRFEVEDFAGAVDLVECNLAEPKAVAQLIAKTQPDTIFHLAGQSSIPHSWKDPVATMNNNILPAINLFEAVKTLRLPVRIQIAGSSEEYGLVSKENLPIRETHALKPLNPYGTSKVAMDLLGRQYFEAFGLSIIRTRSFNHLGPARHKTDVTNEWVRQLVMIERGLSPAVLKVGNLETRRDFLDVRDVVRAYWLGATLGEPGEAYNIASGKCVSLEDLLNQLLQWIPVKVRVEVDPAKLRPADSRDFVGECSKLKNLTGFEPTIPLEESLKNILNFWRGLVTKEEYVRACRQL